MMRACPESTTTNVPLPVQLLQPAAGFRRRLPRQDLLDGRPRQFYLRRQVAAGGFTHLEMAAVQVAHSVLEQFAQIPIWCFQLQPVLQQR
jgi:hypothetical protein